MKLQAPFPAINRRGLRRLSLGFTLAEMMVAVSVFIFVMAGILTAHLYGLRMYQINQTKLTATEWSHNTFGKIADEIRACNSVSILNVDTNGNFTGLLDGEAQQGNGLQIYPTTDTNSFIIYFVNLADQTFRQTIASSNGVNTVILADSVTNTLAFTEQDFSGNVLTSNSSSNNPVIHLALDFYQPQLFMQASNNYKLETSVTRRALQ